MSNEHEDRSLTVYEPVRAANITTVMESLKTIRTFVAEELKDGMDYGIIPGTGRKGEEKKTLLLPGAQKVTMLFNCFPRHRVERHEMENGHVEFFVTTEIISRATGEVVGAGIGSCSTMEGKYRYRNAARRCPACGQPSIIKTNKGRNPGGYWCVPDKGGCGANYNPGDPAVEQQQTGKVENDNIHDTRNTVLKMAKKRAWVDGALGLGCLAELFTQDIEDTHDITPLKDEPPALSPAELSAELRRHYDQCIKDASVGPQLRDAMQGIQTDAVRFTKDDLDALRAACDAKKKLFEERRAKSTPRSDTRLRCLQIADQLGYDQAGWLALLADYEVTDFDRAPDAVVAVILKRLEKDAQETGKLAGAPA